MYTAAELDEEQRTLINRHRRPSIQWLLPGAITLMLSVVLLVLSWWAYRNMAASLRTVAQQRLELVSQQLSQSLQASAARFKLIARERAETPAVRDFLGNGTPDTHRSALSALTYRPNRAGTLVASELLDADGQRVLAAGRDTATVAGQATRLITRTRSAELAAVGTFHAINDSTVVVPAIALVARNGKRLGYLVDWWIIRHSPGEHDLFSRLLGADAAFFLGGRTGVWTNMMMVQPHPHGAVLPGTGVGSYERPDGERKIGISATVPGSPWQLLVEFSEAHVLSPAIAFRNRLLGTTALLIILSFAGAWLISRWVTRPLQQLTAVSEAISAGDYSRRVQIDGLDEVVRLGSAFNLMTTRIQQAHFNLEHKVDELRTTREQFIRSQRMEAVGQLAGGIAHDFNNLLTVILAESEFAATESNAEERDRSIREILRAGERAATLTHQLLAFSRRQLFAPTVFDINELIADMQRMMARLVGDNIKISVIHSANRPNVRADRAQMEQVLANLIVNARDAMPDGGQMTIESRNVVLDEDYARAREGVEPGEYVVISVSDTGVGMSETVKQRIFEPFFTTKEHGRGTGLGLATSYGIVRQSGGDISAYSEPGLGTTMRVFLPATTEQAVTVPHHPVARRAVGDETILLVEDDDAVRNVTARMLKRHGYHVLEAASAEAGLKLLENDHQIVHLLLTDVVLPGMGGREMAEHATRIRPGVKVMFTSGYTDDVVLQHNLILKDATLVGKPFAEDVLSRRVREVLDD